MAIVIKEIHVKTTIESHRNPVEFESQQFQSMKRQLLREVRQLIQKEIKLKKGR